MSEIDRNPKRILGETVRAFKSGLRGEDYTPDLGLSQPPSAPDKYDRLAKLAELWKTGALTEEEFRQEKAKLLKSD